MAGFKTGALCGVAVAGAVAWWWIDKLENEPIRFPGKSVVVEEDFIGVIGSIVGDDPLEADRPVNNLFELFCSLKNRTCDVTTLNEISSRYVDGPSTDLLVIRKWTDREMVADSLIDSAGPAPCTYYEIRVVFDSKDVAYTRLPHPKAEQESCAGIYGEGKSLRQWRIDDGKASANYQTGKAG
jgi:hypothetical protein